MDTTAALTTTHMDTPARIIIVLTIMVVTSIVHRTTIGDKFPPVGM